MGPFILLIRTAYVAHCVCICRVVVYVMHAAPIVKPIKCLCCICHVHICF